MISVRIWLYFRLCIGLCFRLCSVSVLICLICFVRILSCIELIMLLIMFSIRLCSVYVCFDSVSLYQLRLSISLNLDFASVLYI
ncbi:hypothetical protein HanIR_Chr09g0405641 [Helianthus annuus]|nr:hypothetical protein HanIR_Chr09g0405641 [Helianthus annuus]KAJ0541540.1 hypothetical protein HanHA89_Chr09g0329601 [Helianthus annuus]KAJ0706615.1 hypothetical protein HanLR1_Chr09g0309041 [Helianthus annuus]